MRNKNRMGIDELLHRMASPDAVGKPKRNARAHLEKLQYITVYDFYDMPFAAKAWAFIEATKSPDMSAKKVYETCKEGQFDRLESYISQLIKGASIRTLKMKTLANTISEALEDESLTLEKRMEWYELCFVLTAEMDISAKATDSFVHDIEYSRGTKGARLCKGAPGLSRKVEEYRNRSKGKTKGKGSEPVGIDVLLRMMTAGKDGLPPRYFFRRMDSFIFEWNQAKVETTIPDESVAYLVWIGETEFRNKAKCFGLPIRESENVVEYTGKVVDHLLGEVNKEHYGQESARKICRMYELCYELIHLMADYDMGLEHRTLMEIRQSELCDEGEELMEYEIGESERMNRIADELLAMTVTDTRN